MPEILHARRLLSPSLQGYCSFQTVFIMRKKNKTDAMHLNEQIHLFGLSEIKVKRLHILQINLTMTET